MSAKKIAALTAMAYALGNIGGMNIGVETPTITYTPKTKEEIEAEKIAYYKRKGLKEFIINGVPVWALNKKNAVRKYKQ